MTSVSRTFEYPSKILPRAKIFVSISGRGSERMVTGKNPTPLWCYIGYTSISRMVTDAYERFIKFGSLLPQLAQECFLEGREYLKHARMFGQKFNCIPYRSTSLTIITHSHQSFPDSVVIIFTAIPHRCCRFDRSTAVLSFDFRVFVEYFSISFPFPKTFHHCIF